jgi:YesN/AraC family two-component response regulator
MDIKENCKSDERSRLNNEIRNIKTQLSKDFDYTVDLDEYDLKIKNVNQLIEKMDTDSLTIKQLKQIADIFAKNLSQLIKEVRKSRPNVSRNKK